MDPISMSLMLVSAALTGAQGGMSIFGQLMGNRGAKRATRAKVATLRSNIDTIGKQAGFEQSRIYDQVDATLGAQVNFFAGGNIDPTSGSPAILQALTAAQGETDVALAGARGAQKRAETFQQIADLEMGQSDRNTALTFGIGTTLLNTASQWVGLGNSMNQKGAFSGGGSTGASSGTGFNSFAEARRLNGYVGV